jgi:hypothetical protein
VIDPRGLTLMQWADSVVLSLSDAWSFGSLEDEERWQGWATGLVRAFANQSVPDPYGFDDWREWAMRAYPMLEAAT